MPVSRTVWNLSVSGLLVWVASVSIAMAAPTENRGRIAELTIAGFPAIALFDGTIHMPNDGMSFVLKPNEARAAEVLRTQGLPADGFDFSIQTLVVKAAGRALLFDTGAGANLGDTSGYLPASLALAHVQPGKVTDIYISHAHGDHVGGLVTRAGQLAFPNATIHMSRAEWKALQGMTDADAANVGIPNRAVLIAAITPKVVPFATNDTLLNGVVKAVDIPGHTPGHSAYLIGSGRNTVLYIGDSFHHFVTSVSHPEWPISFDNDATLASQSRVNIEPHWADAQQLLFSPHFPFPGYGKIVRSGSSYRWQPQ